MYRTEFADTKQFKFLFLLIYLFFARFSSSFQYSSRYPKPSRDLPLSTMNEMEQKDVNYVQYVDPAISHVLEMRPEEQDTDIAAREDLVIVEHQQCFINWRALEDYIKGKNSVSAGKSAVPMEILVNLASQCEYTLFGINSCHDFDLPSPISGLIAMADVHNDNISIDEKGPRNLIATLIALNMVESSIRHLTGKEHGHAPLLKDMIDILSKRKDDLSPILAPLLTSLLLPKDGINLRNLLWHGFLPTIHRRWLALSIVLVLSMDELARSSSFNGQTNDNATHLSMRNHDALRIVLDHGQSIVASDEKLDALRNQLMQSDTIPNSHKKLCGAALQYIHHPVIFASVVGPLIENSLRIMWCDVNNQDKKIALPGTYYVTLDGHGQRDKHDIILSPFLSNEESDTKQVRNKLAFTLGGPFMALLIDLFVSPPGAPNIRASVAHGVFNRYLFQELTSIKDGETPGARTNDTMTDVSSGRSLDDMTSALISVLDLLSAGNGIANTKGKKINLLESYRPIFSYSALLLQNVDNLVKHLGPFDNLIKSGQHSLHSSGISISSTQRDVAETLALLRKPYSEIKDMQSLMYKCFCVDRSLPWSIDNMFQENSNNLIASECGAATLLLSEIATAAEASLQGIQLGIMELERSDGKQLSSRRRKQIHRNCSMAQLTFDFYSLASFCGLLYIERRISIYTGECPRFSGLSDDMLLLAVKRSRMVVSTFSTASMVDRAILAVQQYLVGKAVKAIKKEVR